MKGDQHALLVGAYAAAQDDSLWQHWAEQAADEIGGIGGLFSLIDRHNGDIAKLLKVRGTAIGWEEYFGGMSQHDPQLAYIASLRSPTLYTDRSHLDLTNPATAEYMRWQVDRTSFHSHVTFAIPLSSGLFAACSLHFSSERFGEAERVHRRYAPLIGGIASAMRLAFNHGETMTEAYWNGIQVERDDRAVLLLDERGAVLRLNMRAEDIVRGGDSLGLRFKRLYCGRPTESERLTALIADAIHPVHPVAGSMRLTRPSGQAAYALNIYPLVRARRFMVAAEATALVTITEGGSERKASQARWCNLFGLTPAEARVADCLKRGEPDAAIATALGLRVSTVRSHAKIILAKTETRSKAELAHLLTGLDRT